MAEVMARFRNAATYTIRSQQSAIDVRTIGGGGSGGTGAAAAFVGGGGGGGAYAGTPNQAVTPGLDYLLEVGAPSGGTTQPGKLSSFSSTSTTETFGPSRTWTLEHAGTNSTGTGQSGAMYLEPTVAGVAPTLYASTGITDRTTSAGPTFPMVPLPTGLQVGDVIFGSCVTLATITAPAGWTLIQPVHLDQYAMAYRVVTSTAESGTTPLWHTSGNAYSMSYAVYRGAKPPIADFAVSVSNAGLASITWPKGTGANRPPKTVRAFVLAAVWQTAEVNYRYDTAPVIEAWDTSFDNTTHTQAYEVMPGAPVTALVRAAAGGAGGNASPTANGANGQGGTVANSIGTNRVAGSNAASAVGGAGANSGTTPTGGASAGQNIPGNAPGGGGGGGGILSAPGQSGARGEALIQFQTGNGTIAHVSQASRRTVLTRLSSGIITHVSVAVRSSNVQRIFTATITHVPVARKALGLVRSGTITHVSSVRKALTLTRSAIIAHVSSVRKALTLTRSATITHTAIFARSVGVARAFSASISHNAKTVMALEARLIPRVGGGITNYIRNNFWFED